MRPAGPYRPQRLRCVRLIDLANGLAPTGSGRVDWSVSVGSSIVRALQHAASAKRVVREHRARLEEHTGARSNDKNPCCCRDEPGDQAYSSRAIRAHLRARGIGSVIPEPDDHKAHRKRRGSLGGRPVTYDRNAYRGRDVID